MTIGELAAMFGAACAGAFVGFFGFPAIAQDDFGGGAVAIVAALFVAPIGFVVGGTICGLVIIFRRPRGDWTERDTRD